MAASKLRNFIFIGAPASGKGSFGTKIAAQRGWSHFSLGDRIREEIAAGTPLGQQVKTTVEMGQLIDDSIATDIALLSLRPAGRQRTQPMILDGFPRTVSQALALHEAMHDEEFIAVHIVLEQWVAIEKTLGRRICATCKRSFNVADVLTQGYDMPAILPSPTTCPLWNSQAGCSPCLEARVDDTREVAENRYQEFLEKTAPLLGFYKERNQLHTFEIKKGMSDTVLLADIMSSS